MNTQQTLLSLAVVIGFILHINVVNLVKTFHHDSFSGLVV